MPAKLVCHDILANFLFYDRFFVLVYLDDTVDFSFDVVLKHCAYFH